MQAWWNFIVSWIPLLLILGFWVFFMRTMKASRYGALTERSFQHMDRVEALLERIAASVEQQPPRS
jgi:ATP-dependent Zn protease